MHYAVVLKNLDRSFSSTSVLQPHKQPSIKLAAEIRAVLAMPEKLPSS